MSKQWEAAKAAVLARARANDDHIADCEACKAYFKEDVAAEVYAAAAVVGG